MNQEIYQDGLKHLLQVEPNFKKFNPAKEINFFLRPEGFEGIASLVIEQQISVQAAESIKKRVFKLMQNISSKEFLKLNEIHLREAGLSRPKISYLHGVACLESDGILNFDDIKKLDDLSARKELCKIRGIGEWTADCYLMASLGRSDIWPVGDIGLQESVRKLKNLKERPNVEDMTSLAREWRPFRSIAANLLWADYDEYN
jgi:DNA-3-methyladenine glycosylase II